MSDEIASATLQTSQKAIEVALELIKMLAPLAQKALSEVYHKSVDGINTVGGAISNIRSMGTVSAKNLVAEAQKASSPISTTSNFLARDAEQIAAKAKHYNIPLAIIGEGEKRTIEFLDRDKAAVEQITNEVMQERLKEMPQSVKCFSVGENNVSSLKSMFEENGIECQFVGGKDGKISCIYPAEYAEQVAVIKEDYKRAYSEVSEHFSVSADVTETARQMEISARINEITNAEIGSAQRSEVYENILSDMQNRGVELPQFGENNISIEEYNKGEDVVSSKYDFFLSFFETIMGKQGISPEQKTIIDNCLHEVYRDFLLGKTTEMPTLKDYYDILCKQTSEEAKPLYMSLELYVNGSMKTFSYPSNVDVNNRVVVYDIKDLGKQLKPLGMMVVLENLWDKIVRNRERGIRTRIYIDEIYLLFRNEESANFLFELYKRARKWGGIPTGITQNVEDLLKSDTARSMLSNSEFILMLNQAASDREQLARILKIPDAMMKFVTGAPAGSGLIYCGLNGSLPFKDDFPTDTKLYKLMTTKFCE